MLQDFILANRERIIDRVQKRVEARMPSQAVIAKMSYGIPIFLTQLADALGRAGSVNSLRLVRTVGPADSINDTAALHGRELLQHGFTVGQVVHGYGDVCQIVTELAGEMNATISAQDFHCFNLCLDDAIAGAVTAYGHHVQIKQAKEGNERRGVLAHELRNLLHTATLSFEVMRQGTVGPAGSTGAVHARSLASLSMLVERSLAEVRLETATPLLERLLLVDFIEEVQVVATMQAVGTGHTFFVADVDSRLAIDADRQLLASAVSNLLQNAFKFTPQGGKVSLLTRSTPARVLIDVSDECGGLAPKTIAHLFRPFMQAGADRSGLGLGLTIAMAAARANNGDITVQDVPGKGCVFTVDLPRQPPPATPIFGEPPTDQRAADASRSS
jgi:signal transduction histidine kinase